MAPADDAKAAAAEPTPAPAPAAETPAPARSPSARKAKTAAKKPALAKEAPKARKPRAKKAAAPKSSVEPGPSYFDLIVDAIKELKERNGSSRQAIAKVVEAQKPNYASHHLNKALRTAVGAGKFIQVKGSYKLSPELRKPAASKKKGLKVSEKSAKTVTKVAKVAKKSPTAKKAAAKKTAAKKVAAKKAPAKKTAAKKAPAKKTAAKKTVTKKAAPKKAAAKKTTAKKATAKTAKKVVKKTAKNGVPVAAEEVGRCSKLLDEKGSERIFGARCARRGDSLDLQCMHLLLNVERGETSNEVRRRIAKTRSFPNLHRRTRKPQQVLGKCRNSMARLLYRAVTSAAVLTATLSSFTAAQYSNSSSSAGTVSAGVEDEDFGVGCGGDMDYPTSTDESTMQPRFAYLVTNPLADFIAVHFKEFNLPDSDYVQVRAADPAAKDTRVLQYRGNDSSGSFYSDALSISSVIVELFTDATSSLQTANITECVGFAVDSYQYLGQGASLSGAKEEVCGADNSQEARCYSSDFPSFFQASNAVARLLIKKSTGSFFCTGWLLGSEGHLVTNHHCISTQAHASNTEFEFMAEGSSCSVNCASPRSCVGSIRASSATLIYADPTLDYALVKLPINLSGQYGYLRLRSSGAVMDERVYVPQHPSGWGKRIAIKSDNGYGTVTSLTMGGCANNQVAYYLDTQGGSSGSPLISWADNMVVALHHCGGCPNTAINSYKLVNDMKWRGILPANACT
ncbi:unnamed protein product [Phytophthora lilii]|uniref:Unnamed protein product n=1 Tax=Phytophthora lilii TaxID=2077276 RepID=A0A9W6WUV1_9STRA|nr:unnamed protein product [Phytophthora lilii]